MSANRMHASSTVKRLFLTAMLCCLGAGITDTAAVEKSADERLWNDFLTTSSQDIEACFKNMPEMQTSGPPATFDKGQASSAAPVMNRLVVAMDASGSMAARIGGQTKMDAAKSAVIEFLNGVPSNVEVGLVAFGHRGTNAASGKAESCALVETVAATSKDRAQTAQTMRALKATGWTPLASAITQAGKSFTPTNIRGSQVVYVVSDGLETCGGDPVAAARALNTGNVQAIVNIIGFDLKPTDQAQLQAVASAGGGQFVEAKTVSDLQKVLAESSRNTRNAVTQSRETIKSSIKIAQNTTRTAVAVAGLRRCVSTKVAQETRKIAGFMKGWTTDPAARKAFDDQLRARHDGYENRVAAIEAQANANQNSANNELKRRQEETDKAAAQAK